MNGQRIVVTRAPHQADEFCALLEQRGAVALTYPVIELAPPDDHTALQSALEQINTFDWLMLTSRNTVHVLSEMIDSLPDALKIGVVGQVTADALMRYFGRKPHIIPQTFTAAALVAALPSMDDQRVFVPQSALADDRLSNALTAQNAQVIAVDAYQMRSIEVHPSLAAELRVGRVDALTFTSGSTVHNFVQQVSDALHLAQALPCCCIGTSTREAAIKAGFTCLLMPSRHTLTGMVDELDRFFEEN
jgi:uroporphyrinogen III methyltransferase / synthase